MADFRSINMLWLRHLRRTAEHLAWFARAAPGKQDRQRCRASDSVQTQECSATRHFSIGFIDYASGIELGGSPRPSAICLIPACISTLTF
jgi:hypothetical protein